MSNFVSKPNLPNARVKTVICGTKDTVIIDFIKSFNIEIIESDINENVDQRISRHSDISVHHLGNNEIILDTSQYELYKKLNKLGFRVYLTDSKCKAKYPDDCRLNFARLGKYLIGSEKAADKNLLEYANKNDLVFINTKQGYGKCSTLVLSENALITDDPSVYVKAVQNDLNCLIIDKGDIKLSGFNYGFIGGSGAMIDKNHLLFFGDITEHRSYEKIKMFLKEQKIAFEYISGYPMTDIGGIIPIIET